MSDPIRGEWRAHWRVVAGTFVGMGLAFPSWTFVQSQFVQPLQKTFGWSRAQISFAFGIHFFVCFIGPMLGRIIDRVGVRPVLLSSLVLVGAGYGLLANTTGAYPLFVAECLLLAAVGLGSTGVAYTRAVSCRWCCFTSSPPTAGGPGSGSWAGCAFWWPCRSVGPG
jgi:MFS family permease